MNMLQDSCVITHQAGCLSATGRDLFCLKDGSKPAGVPRTSLVLFSQLSLDSMLICKKGVLRAVVVIHYV